MLFRNQKKILTGRFFLFTLDNKVLFMNDVSRSLNTLQDIKQMMEQSSRFISLSGFSGMAAGVCALIGAWYANTILPANLETLSSSSDKISIFEILESPFLKAAVVTFVSAFIFAFLFTYMRSKKNGTPVWSATSKRLLLNVSVPMIVGAIFLIKLVQNGNYGLVAPGCLIFYGLALINAGKYTLGEIRYLGFAEVVTGLVSLFVVGYGLYFWAFGFGFLHIFYGSLMWWKYERN